MFQISLTELERLGRENTDVNVFFVPGKGEGGELVYTLEIEIVSDEGKGRAVLLNQKKEIKTFKSLGACQRLVEEKFPDLKTSTVYTLSWLVDKN